MDSRQGNMLMQAEDSCGGDEVKQGCAGHVRGDYHLIIHFTL
jgi:hypothetical protein